MKIKNNRQLQNLKDKIHKRLDIGKIHKPQDIDNKLKLITKNKLHKQYKKCNKLLLLVNRTINKGNHTRERVNLQSIQNIIYNIKGRIANQKTNKNTAKVINLQKLLIKYQSGYNMNNVKIIRNKNVRSKNHKMPIHKNTHSPIQRKSKKTIRI